MMRLTQALLLGAACVALTSCQQENHQIVSPDSSEGISARTATAIMAPLTGSRAVGVVTFTQTDKGVKVIADIEGLSPGSHGFHIHEFGVCVADGSSAGGHFNPGKDQHAGPDNANRHAGDLGNLIADELGHAHYERVDSKITLQGADSIVGRSVIVHEKTDDFTTQPTGNSGGRMSCGLIEKVN